MAKDDESIYNDEKLEELSTDEEITPEEEGFMSGYNAAAGDYEEPAADDDEDEKKSEEE